MVERLTRPRWLGRVAMVDVVDFMWGHTATHKNVNWEVVKTPVNVYFCCLGVAKGNYSLRDWLTPERMRQLGIDPSQRPERLEVADFVSLANAAADSSARTGA